MQTNMQKRGFTLIELLVVIVIIGILATISVATFSGYFSRARDAERQAAVRNAATLIKTYVAVNGSLVLPDALDTTAKVEAAILSEGGYKIPDAQNGYEYYYAYGGTAGSTSGGFQFVIAACSETESSKEYVDGTAKSIDDVECAAGSKEVTKLATADGITSAMLRF